MKEVLPPDARLAWRLMSRALGGPVSAVGFDVDGRPARIDGDPSAALDASGYRLPPALRDALLRGHSRVLECDGVGFRALAAAEQDGLLWVLLAPSEDLHLLPRFAQHLVHQLRNGLSSVKLSTQALLRAELGPRERKRAELGLREVLRMEQVLSAASEFAEAPSRPHERVDLGAILGAAARATADELTGRKVVLQLRVEPDVPALQGDRARLQLCFEALLTWAARSLEPDAILEAALSAENGAPVLRLREAPASSARSGALRAHLALALAHDVAAELGGGLELAGAAGGVELCMRLGPQGGAHGHAAPGG